MTDHFLSTAIDTQKAIDALQKGEVAVVVLAGGLGSRLGSNAPKGTYPISQVKKKSLFQLIVEKTLAVAKAYDSMPHIAIMTSEENHAATLQHFSEANFFGLPAEYLSFFVQSSLPLLDDDNAPVYTTTGKPLSAPNGNGLFFESLAASGILDRWKTLGIKCITVVLVDNPLADPFLLPLISLHLKQDNAITVVAVERINPEESVGVIIEKERKLCVVEYTELSDDERHARDTSGRLKHPLANISFFAFSLAFLEQMAKQPLQMPLHRVKKAITAAQQKLLGNDMPLKLWKSEYFIFDLLAFAERSSVLLMDRDETFCPLKNGHGEYSEAFVQRALLRKDQKQFYAITHVKPPEDQIFELSQDFYYPTKELLARWKDQPLPQDPYISS